jgi:cytochrome c oxidase cbb3-type subunit 3/ubiquinol-cytochrome c reductase cytochrome c subunit
MILACALLSACITDAEPPPGSDTTNIVDTGPLIPEDQKLYDQYCGFCHGYEGEGYLADNANALANPDFLASVTDVFIRDAIIHGRPGTPMPAWGLSYGGPLVNDHVDAVVGYIRKWQSKDTVELHEDPIEGNQISGQSLFKSQCSTCHGIPPAGHTAMSLNNPWFLHTASDAFIHYAISEGRAPTPMPAFKDQLQPDEINDLTAYLRGQAEEVVDEPLEAFVPDWSDHLINPDGDAADFTLKSDIYVAAADVFAAIESGKRVILSDARPYSDYLYEHISGAIAIPFYEVEAASEFLPKETWIVVYCGCPHAISGQAAATFKELGFDKVAVLDEGFVHWKNMGYGTSRGTERYENLPENR